MNLEKSARLNRVLSALAPITSVSVPTIGTSVGVVIQFNGATGAQQTAANNALAAFDWSDAAQAAWQTDQDRAGAIAAFLLDTSASSKVLRGAILALLDQINVIRAALPKPLPAITIAQAKTAIQNKINSGIVD